MVESKHEEFRNLKQGSLSVYDYNKLFQKLARFAKQDVPDEKSMIYQFRGGLREEIQLALVLFEPLRYDEFYNMALNQEAAQLKCDASKKRVRDATPSSSTQVAKQQKYWLPPPPFRQSYQQKSKGGSGCKREEFRNLKQGSLSVYDYNKLFQKLARFAKQDVPDEKSMLY